MPDVFGAIISGLVAGVLGGLLGIGGGIILIPFLRYFVGLSPPAAAGTCVVAVFCTTLSGSYRHYRLGHVSIRSILPVICAGVVATAIFSLAFLWVAQWEQWLDTGTGFVFSLISLRMILEGICERRLQRPSGSNAAYMPGSLWHKFAIGAACGVLPGLLGIGTGGILVPAFSLLLRTPIKIAIGCSLACFSVNALVSSVFKLCQGSVNLPIAGPACLGTLVGAYLGANLNRGTPSSALKIMFGALFAYESLKLML